MKNLRLFTSLTDIKDEMILEADGNVSLVAKKSNKKIYFIIPMLAAALVGIMLNQSKGPGTLPNGPKPLLPPMASQPYDQIRQFINYDNSRYAVINTLEEKDFDKTSFEKNLGKIQYNLLDEKQDLEANFAGSFALGGDIYSLKEYDYRFRLAVVHSGKVYIVENVDNINGKKLDLEAYFKYSQLIENTKKISIYNHRGILVFKDMTEKSSKELLEELSKSKYKKMTTDEHEKMGEAQANGKSFLLKLHLKDQTENEIYVIPELGLVSIGDNTYQMTKDAKEMTKDLTKDLEIITPPMQ